MKRSLHLSALTVLAALVLALMGPLVGTASAADPATVTVTTPNTKYPAGVNAEVTITVANGGNGTLTVRAQTADGKSYLLNCGAGGVNDATQSCSVYMLFTTRVVATVTGGTNGDATASKKLQVYPTMATSPRSPRTYSGSTAVFQRGVEPLFSTSVYPARKSMCIRHQVQVRRAAGWATIVTGSCKQPDSEARVAWRWYGSHPVGYKFRVNATFAGDTLNGPGSGSWSYFYFK